MQVLKFLFLILFALSACGSPTTTAATSPTRYATMSDMQLWVLQGSTQSGLELALVEAELGGRGQTSYGTWYLGKRTGSAVGRVLYAREDSGGNDLKNCSDFSSAASAQKYFLAAGGPRKDPNNLDLDGDGMACEWGTEIKRIASVHVAASVVPRTTYRPSTCYTGSRGGTYTITASGKRDYNGC